jgi:crossover junction endodeoxyribonuclease RuvC
MVAVRILGIDPGTVVLGFACVEFDEFRRDAARREAPIALRAANVVCPVGAVGAAARLVDAGAVRLGARGAPVAARLGALHEVLEGLLARFRPDEIALEEAFHGKSAQSALRIGEARGVVLANAHRCGVPIHQYPPASIKRRIAGHGGASKEAVARMAGQLLGLRGLAGPSDATDAVAVALCRLEERRFFRG